MIDWKCSKEDFTLILAVAMRVQKEYPEYPDKQSILLMDLQACHGNGCPLDLEGMMHADRLDLMHDVLGIRRHINRDTGKLEGCFEPRYAKRFHPSPASPQWETATPGCDGPDY
jgi:hypothetical protein